ncbi:MAG TPA: universal stress protein [Desulfobacterales bacterium]|jgi:nucleotide-binding universal stress UspA family protein|nr:universal stress protein [Desulfobacterales bacterium]
MKILVAYDGSKVTKEALQLAIKHAGVFNGSILLVHSMVGGPEIPRKEFEAAEKELQQQEIMLKGDGLSCETLLSVRGLEAGEDMVRIATEKKVDEIIIGLQRKSKVGKLLFGSTAQYIILNAPCPVVTIR